MTTAPFPGAAGDVVKRVVLRNGLTVLARRDASAPVAAIVTHVKAGYFDEPDDVVGIAHVLEHMYFKGTPTRGPGDIARDTKAAGGYLNAGTIYDYTSYYAVVPATSFATALEIQADAYAHSLIDGAELARELEVIIEEERRKRDTPSAVATEACYALLHDVHRMRRWRIGTPDVLRRFTRDDVSRFYRTHYVPAQTILSVVGDIDPDDAVAAIERLYGVLGGAAVPHDRGEPEPDHTGFRWQDLVRDVEQAQIVLGWRTVAPTHADAPALDIAGALLGAGRASRLYREVRERSLASAGAAYHYTPTELGVFVVTAESPPDRHAAAARAAWAQVRAIAAETPGAPEVLRVQRGIEARWWRRLESMEGQATYLASWEALGGWETGAAYLDALLAVTPDAVRDVASRYMTLDRSAIVTLRPESAHALAGDVPGARAALGDEVATRGVRRDAAAIESPALVGLGVRAERVVSDVAVFRTEGGVPILVRRKPGAPIAHVQALLAGGVTDEAVAQAGRTTLLARTALQGTAHRDGPQLAEDVETLGGALGTVVGAEAFGWTLSVPTAQFGAATTALAEVVETPRLAGDALDTERAIALAGLAQLRDDIGRQPIRLALATAFPEHPYGRPTLGNEDGLQRCTPKSLRTWHERRVRRGHGVIVVVADAPPDEIAATVRGAFRALAQGERHAVAPVSWPDGSRESLERRDKAQTALSLLFPSPPRAELSRYAAALLATVASGLGGRFFQALRDRESLAYAVSVGTRAWTRAGLLLSYIACAPSKEGAARDGLIRECIRLADDPVTDEELARAKAYTLGSLAIRQHSAAAVLSDIADAWLFGTLEELDEEPRAIAAQTGAALRDVAMASVAPGRAVWGVVRGTAR